MNSEAKTMELQCQPYNIHCIGETSNGYLFEGYPDRTQWEDVYELIRLVERISKHFSIPIVDSHIVANKGDEFITFIIPKNEDKSTKRQVKASSSVSINPIVDIATFSKLLERAVNSTCAPCADGICDMIIDDCANEICDNRQSAEVICDAYAAYLEVMLQFADSPELSSVTIEDFENLLNDPEEYLAE